MQFHPLIIIFYSIKLFSWKTLITHIITCIFQQQQQQHNIHSMWEFWGKKGARILTTQFINIIKIHKSNITQFPTKVLYPNYEIKNPLLTSFLLAPSFLSFFTKSLWIPLLEFASNLPLEWKWAKPSSTHFLKLFMCSNRVMGMGSTKWVLSNSY